MFDKYDAMKVAEELGIKFDKFSLDDFLTGLNIELEHGTINPLTNVTNDSIELTAKIALAHLNEFSDYYNKYYGLPELERNLENINKLS